MPTNTQICEQLPQMCPSTVVPVFYNHFYDCGEWKKSPYVVFRMLPRDPWQSCDPCKTKRAKIKIGARERLYKGYAKNPVWGSDGVWEVHFYSKFQLWIAQKLRIIILLNGELVTFRFHFPKSQKTSFSWFLDLVDMSMTPKANYFWLWRHQIAFKIPRKCQIISGW